MSEGVRSLICHCFNFFLSVLCLWLWPCRPRRVIRALNLAHGFIERTKNVDGSERSPPLWLAIALQLLLKVRAQQFAGSGAAHVYINHPDFFMVLRTRQ